MASWHNILCCDGLSELLRRARYGGLPPTLESARLFDYLLEHAENLPLQDDPNIPLTLSNYKDAILSVARFGDPTDVTWPVRYFAISTTAEESMKGVIEIEEKKVLAAEAQGVLEDPYASMVECWFGDCVEHENLLFHIRYRPLREEPSSSCEGGENKRKVKRESGKASLTYPFSKANIQAVGSLSFSDISEGPEDLIPRVDVDDYVPEIEGDFPDGNPLSMVHHPSYPYRGDSQDESMSMDQASRVRNHPENFVPNAFHCSYPYQADLPQKEEPAEDTVKEEPTEEMFMQAVKQRGKHQDRERLINYDLRPDVDF